MGRREDQTWQDRDQWVQCYFKAESGSDEVGIQQPDSIASEQLRNKWASILLDFFWSEAQRKRIWEQFALKKQPKTRTQLDGVQMPNMWLKWIQVNLPHQNQVPQEWCHVGL